MFLFCGDADLDINEELLPFVADGDTTTDITVWVSRDWERAELPKTVMTGQDAILEYYQEDDIRFCIAKGGPKGPLACTVYTTDFERLVCMLNDKPFLYPTRKLGSILRMLPMREIFLHYHTLFLHASQISIGGKGILFTARSGMGKSTQARLWQSCRNAEIVCNDRTLTRKTDGKWFTYGYPLDGSAPVRSNQVNQLGCVVLLEQGSADEVQRMRPAKAISRLMQQVVMDCWSGEAQTKAMALIAELLEDIPVYLLTCTPDVRAVETLESKLIEDEVIYDGRDFRSVVE